MTRAHTETPAPLRRSSRGDVFSGVIVAAAGALLFLMALNIGDSVRPAPGIGPATLPKALSVLLFLSGLALVLLGLRQRPVPRIEDALKLGGPGGGMELATEEPPVPPRKLAVVVGMFIAYAVIFIPFGYMLSTALYLAAMVTIIDREKWKRNVVFAVVFAVLVYYTFTELLDVRLPAGVLG